MKKVGIIGSREYPHLGRVHNYVSTLPEGTVIVSGGARGVDKTAEDAADARGLEKIVHLVTKAEWGQYGKAAGPMRNARIVEDADMIVAFWDGESTGTLDSIKKAVKLGKKVVIYGM